VRKAATSLVAGEKVLDSIANPAMAIRGRGFDSSWVEQEMLTKRMNRSAIKFLIAEGLVFIFK